MFPTCQARGRRTCPPGSQEPPASESRGQPVTVQGADTLCPETLSLQVQEVAQCAPTPGTRHLGECLGLGL